MVILEGITHTIEDIWLLFLFLYITYLFMEFLERRAGEKTEQLIRRAGEAGPLFGGLLGALPQCGFSAAGANLYAARLLTPGTLIALFLSTSDEMIPVMLSSSVSPLRILKLVAIKVVVAILAGFAVDLLLRRVGKQPQRAPCIEEFCKEGHCHCEGHAIWISALIHTISVWLVVFVVSFALHLVLHLGGEELLTQILGVSPILACLISALVGMIPNCASSVAITQLHLAGGLSTGALLSGLLTGAGVGLLVLVRVNRPHKDTLRLLLLLYVIGVGFGVLFDVSGLGALLGV